MNDHPKPQDSQTYGGMIKWVIQCPPIDPRIPLTEENRTKGNVFRRGALFHCYLSAILYTGNALFEVICVKKKDLSLRFFGFILGSIVLKKIERIS